MNIEDDGSLEWLKIPADQTNRHFNCPETTQQKLTNLTFWVFDYIEGMRTKFGEGRVLVKIKMNKDDSDSENLLKKIIKKEEYGNCFLRQSACCL